MFVKLLSLLTFNIHTIAKKKAEKYLVRRTIMQDYIEELLEMSYYDAPVTAEDVEADSDIENDIDECASL